MKQQNLTEISRVSGKSVSTVSKALRGCGGVDAETRERIFCAAASVRSQAYEAKKTDVFVILPEKPTYFWNRVGGVLKQSSLPITLKIFSGIQKGKDEFVVASYIEEAASSGARALILSAHLNEALQSRVAELAKTMLVIQLCEYTPIPNTFFVGSDGAHDGDRLAKQLPCKTDRPINVGVLTGALSDASARRVDGFLAALPSAAQVFLIEKPTAIELCSSHLARAIDALGVPLDYLFCFDGITTAACDALYKLREKMQTRLLGFEYPPTAQKHMEAGRILALAVQRLEEQMRAALSMTERYLRTRCYPDSKYQYVPSALVVSDSNEGKYIGACLERQAIQ